MHSTFNKIIKLILNFPIISARRQRFKMLLRFTSMTDLGLSPLNISYIKVVVSFGTLNKKVSLFMSDFNLIRFVKLIMFFLPGEGGKLKSLFGLPMPSH